MLLKQLLVDSRTEEEWQKKIWFSLLWRSKSVTNIYLVCGWRLNVWSPGALGLLWAVTWVPCGFLEIGRMCRVRGGGWLADAGYGGCARFGANVELKAWSYVLLHWDTRLMAAAVMLLGWDWDARSDAAELVTGVGESWGGVIVCSPKNVISFQDSSRSICIRWKRI